MNPLHLTCYCLFLVVTFGSCKREKHHQVESAFYYWKTSFKLNEKEQQELKALNVNHLYLRFLDVDWDVNRKSARPVCPMIFNQQFPATLKPIPVVFITNKTLLQVDRLAVNELADNIMHFVRRQCELQKINPAEIQIDCDWTKQSMVRYFLLLRRVKEHEYLKGKMLSATIRMHQIKYRTSKGVPPVDKGLLMCYNMGDLRKYGDHNSILDQHTIEDYLANLSSYPLKLDVALPLFSWSVLFRNQLYAGLLRDLKPSDFQNEKVFEKQGKRCYQVLNNVNLNGYLLKKGEVLRDESYSARDIIQAAKYCSTNLSTDSVRVILFHLDSSILNNYHTNELEKIYHSFR
ncbi:hypothetical protein NF867_12120 [Solitalea sp. MAHUQ-68]|uniref:Uncharacterized protein n=1 Tax=Solitalea agri TaxID=2953739 RepID=A0A9X2F2Q0_9SPHI|nr:hypothetical protein [Solitalea agri]MCO4293612.1 hypothetical protein [Solitalea agri]